MRPVAWRSVASATGAPLLLIGGWTLAAVVQPAGFSSTSETISYLAGQAATDSWIMTAALVGTGICHIVTASGLHPARIRGRWLLAVGGATLIGVGVFPISAAGERAAPVHSIFAVISFGAMSLWPAFGCRSQSKARAAASSHGPVPVALVPKVAITAAFAMSGAVVWFFWQAASDGDLVGLSERVAAGSQALWPFATVLSALLLRRVRR